MKTIIFTILATTFVFAMTAEAKSSGYTAASHYIGAGKKKHSKSVSKHKTAKHKKAERTVASVKKKKSKKKKKSHRRY